MITKAAIFFENYSLEGMDLSNIAYENPGISATMYMFFVVGQSLAVKNNSIDMTIYTTNKMKFADGVRAELASSMIEAYHKCCMQNIDYLIIKHSKKFLNDIKQLNSDGHTKFIIWCENFADFKDLNFYAKCALIARLICVGREQADIYRDHRAFQKTDWIYNCIDNRLLNIPQDDIVPTSRRKHIVTYIGAIIPGKGFHVLAKAWPEVVKAVPDAQLYVIGSGKLYGGHVELGRWELAEKNYEDSFMKYLTKDEKLLPGVHLMGIMGAEKFDILSKTKVGVPNPSGLTETFCNSAVEMQFMGAIIASRRCTGYMDTVKNGQLIDNPRDLAAAIVNGLNSLEDTYPQTRLAIEQNFSQSVVISQWEKLLIETLPQGKRLNPLLPLINPNFEMKQWKESLRKLKERHPWLYTILPSLGFFTEFWKALKWAIWKRTILK